MSAGTRISAAIAAVAAPGMLYAGLPWVVLLLLVAALLGALICVARTELARLVMISLAALVIALAAFEGYLLHQEGRGDGTRMEGTIVENFTQRDHVRGYRPKPGSRITARKLYGDSVIYDVVYTIDADGRRVSPSSQGKAPAGCVVFFGDSVTFGEGVNDEQAYPYVVGLRGRGDYAVYNFAFSGYGPHPMLAGLQAGIAERIMPCRSARFVHLTILEHIARVAGLAHWDRHGPRFRLDAGGRAVRDGNFDDFAAGPERYLLGPHDGHPNAAIHARIAENVAARIINRPGT